MACKGILRDGGCTLLSASVARRLTKRWGGAAAEEIVEQLGRGRGYRPLRDILDLISGELSAVVESGVPVNTLAERIARHIGDVPVSTMSTNLRAVLLRHRARVQGRAGNQDQRLAA